MYIYMHIYVFVLRILNRKIHIFCTLTSFLMFLISALPFSVSLHIFFLDPFENTLQKLYPLPFSMTYVHHRNKHTKYNYQFQKFSINNNAFISSPYSNFTCSIVIFFPVNLRLLIEIFETVLIFCSSNLLLLD